VISFRQHVVSLVAVFLALAVGLVLGAGPLSGTSGDDDTAADTGAEASSSADTGADTADDGGDAAAEDTEGEGAAGESAYDERFAAAAGARLYGGALAAAPVAIVTMPGADRELVRALSDQVKVAGGRVTGRYVVQAALLDPAEESGTESAGAALAAQVAAPGVDPAADTWTRAGQLLGAAVATTVTTVVPPDQVSLTVRGSLADAGLVTSPSVPVADAPLVLVVLAPGDEEAADDQADTAAALIGGLSSQAVGTVVLGDEASAEAGTLAALRATQPPGALATVDDPGTALGPVSAALALTGLLQGRTGAFGPSSADGALPLG
jgi:hypothetical protein